jgi:hypothetical protein
MQQLTVKLRLRDKHANAAKNIHRAKLSTLVEGASTGTPWLRSLGLQAEE